MKKFLLGACIVAACAGIAHADVIEKARKADAQQAWSAWGGSIGVRWNEDLLSNLGISVGKPSELLAQQDYRRHQWFPLRESGGLQFLVSNNSLDRFSGGELQMRGGYVLNLRDGSQLDMRNLSLRVRANDPKILDVVSADGKVWFYSDRIMFELADKDQTLAIRAADIRIAPALAARLGMPEAADWEVADLAMNTQVYITGSNEVPAGSCTVFPWPGVEVPGVAGATYQADLFMQTFSISPVGCQNCDGSGGSNDGIVAWAPSSTLRNNVNNGSAQATVAGDPLGTSTALYTGDVAWFTKFSGVFPPYNNDQHPFLIWNLYRINANGSIEQIGRSGVKHAFLTVNSGCQENVCTEYGSHALRRGCADTYGTGNNDSPSDMGPRSEIVPAEGIWGRCGSIFDPNCTGTQQSNGNSSWTQRMKTNESQIDPAVNSGATFMMDSWYVAREDINIYNSMATVTGTPNYTGSQWTFSGQSNYKLGAAIDRWVDPTSPPANAMNAELVAPEGHAKVAVKATDLGDGTWRYDYAVMNLDFARAVIQEPEHGPDPRVVSNRGFGNFSIPLPAGSTVSAMTFSDGDLDSSNDWYMMTANGRATWSSTRRVPSANTFEKPTLDWGTLYSFSITVNHAPTTGTSGLYVAQTGSPSSYTVATLVPGS